MGQPLDKYEADREALLALLRSVSDELYGLVCEIVRLGESLSADELEGDKNRRICDLQSFDLLAQTALAQARLLQGIEQGIAGRQDGNARSIKLLIADVPFHKARQRLSAAYEGEKEGAAEGAQSQLPWDDAGGLDWF
jgi:hypothetical protein